MIRLQICWPRRRNTVAAVAVSVLVVGSGCCPSHQAAVIVGGTADQCYRYLESREPPPAHTLACPGDQVIACWSADPSALIDVQVESDVPQLATTSAQPRGHTSGTLQPDSVGNVSFRFRWNDDDCKSSSLDQSITIPPRDGVALRYHTKWVSGKECIDGRFDIDTKFTSPRIVATEVTAHWEPKFSISTAKVSGEYMCDTPPFLRMDHPDDFYNQLIDYPMVTTGFSRDVKAIGGWIFESRFLPDCINAMRQEYGREVSFQCGDSLPYDLRVVCPDRR
jgi:hypothetical protein